MKLYTGSLVYMKIISSLKLDIVEKPPSCSESLTIGFCREEEVVTDDAIRKLLTKWVIPICFHEYEEFFSSYFHDKSTFRFILNLKSLRDANSPISIEPHHTRLLFNANSE